MKNKLIELSYYANLARENLRIISIICLVSISLLLATIKHPPLIAVWEGAVIYQSFNPGDKPPLVLAIQKGGDTAGYHGKFGYTLLTASRWIADIFGHKISIIRVLPVFYGLTSLLLLYIAINRWHGWETAFFATAILATNQTFLIFQHNLLPQILAMLCVLLCIERFQNLKEKGSRFAAITLGVACAIAAINYLIARICMLAILCFYLLDFDKIASWKNKFSLVITNHRRLKNTLIVFLSLIAALTLFYPGNLILFFNKGFIFSHLGEYDMHPTSGLGNILHNMKVFVYYYIIGTRETVCSSNVMVHAPYPVENKLVIVLWISGMVLYLKRFKEYKIAFFYYLFFVLVLAIFLSQTFPERSFETSSTMSPYRTFLLILFVVIFASLCLKFIYERIKYQNRWYGLIFMILICTFILVRIVSYYGEVGRYQKYIERHNFDFTQPAIVKEWNEPSFTISARQEFQINQVYFYKLARYIKNQINLRRPRDSGVKPIYIPSDYYTPDYYRFGGLVPEKTNLFPYYLPMYLTFYLQETGLNVRYLVKKQDYSSFLQKSFRHVENHNVVKTVIKFMEGYKPGQYLLNILYSYSIINQEAEIIGEYVVHATGTNRAEYLLLTDEDQLETYKNVKKIRNDELFLFLPCAL